VLPALPFHCYLVLPFFRFTVCVHRLHFAAPSPRSLDFRVHCVLHPLLRCVLVGFALHVHRYLTSLFLLCVVIPTVHHTTHSAACRHVLRRYCLVASPAGSTRSCLPFHGSAFCRACGRTVPTVSAVPAVTAVTLQTPPRLVHTLPPARSAVTTLPRATAERRARRPTFTVWFLPATPRSHRLWILLHWLRLFLRSPFLPFVIVYVHVVTTFGCLRTFAFVTFRICYRAVFVYRSRVLHDRAFYVPRSCVLHVTRWNVWFDSFVYRLPRSGVRRCVTFTGLGYATLRYTHTTVGFIYLPLVTTLHAPVTFAHTPHSQFAYVSHPAAHYRRRPHGWVLRAALCHARTFTWIHAFCHRSATFVPLRLDRTTHVLRSCVPLGSATHAGFYHYRAAARYLLPAVRLPLPRRLHGSTCVHFRCRARFLTMVTVVTPPPATLMDPRFYHAPVTRFWCVTTVLPFRFYTFTPPYPYLHRHRIPSTAVYWYLLRYVTTPFAFPLPHLFTPALRSIVTHSWVSPRLLRCAGPLPST